MKILIIGGTAFMGPFLVRELIEKGHELTLFHRGKTALTTPHRCAEVLGDRNEISQYRERFRQEKFDVVIDMIALTEAHSQRIVDIFDGFIATYIVISSMDVYRAYDIMRGVEEGPLEPVPLTEESTLRTALYPYKGSGGIFDEYDKILVEQAAQSKPSLPAISLRMPMIYGPGDLQHRFYPYLQQMNDKRPFIILEKKYADWCWTRGYVADCAHAITLVTEKEISEHRVYNVAEPDTSSIRDWLGAMASYLDWQGDIISLSRELLPPDMQSHTSYHQHLVVSSDKIREECGFTEITTREVALGQTIEWEVKNPPSTVEQIREGYDSEDKLVEKLRATGKIEG